MFLLVLCTLAFAEDLWAVGPTEGVRWPDAAADAGAAPIVSVKLAEGDRVELLVRDGETVRIRKGTDFGWVPATALTNVEPIVPTFEDDAGGELPTFTLPGAEETTPTP